MREVGRHRLFREGFTLLELLVVIGIIGILFAACLPAYNRIKSKAKATQCTAKLREIGVAVNLYLGDHGLRFPRLATARESRDDTETPVLETALLEYVDDEFIFHCPADDRQLFETSGSSYLWNSIINGQKLGNMNLMGIVKQESGIPIVCDKENFHKNIGGEVNILYADGHILKELKFNVELEN